MADPRYKKLAEVLTGYSTALKKGDRVGVHLPVAALHLFPDGTAPDQTAMAAE